MKTQKRSALLLTMMVTLLLLAACAGAEPSATTVPATEPPVPTETPPPPAEAATGITVTFEGEQCLYQGPEHLSAGEIPLTLDVRGQSARERYKVVAYTLDEGKTVEDLRGWASVGHSPLWARFHGMLDEPPGALQNRTLILFEGPLFLACITDPPDTITEVLGPIEIEASTASLDPASQVDTAASTDTPLAADTPLPTDRPTPTEPPPLPTDTPEPQPEDRTWPTKRESFAMAYDPQLDAVLLFCGYDVFVGGVAWQHEMDLAARDEWAYDVGANRLEQWAVVPAVIYQQAVYDSQSEKLVAFGPETTRVYNTATRTWEKTNPAEEPPPFRFWSALAYDSQSDRVILFGGEPYEQDDTWAYDYDTNTWAEMTPEFGPSYRWGHAMAYDAESDRVILWGASEIARRLMSDEERATVWAYDYESNSWAAIESTGGPSYRGGHTMVYHPGTDRIILFGGLHSADIEFSDETWAYDYNSNTWTQLHPANHPSGRRLHSMVYDEGADKMVLFGGIAGTWLKEEINDEMWIFDPVAEEWSQVLPGSTAP